MAWKLFCGFALTVVTTMLSAAIIWWGYLGLLFWGLPDYTFGVIADKNYPIPQESYPAVLVAAWMGLQWVNAQYGAGSIALTPGSSTFARRLVNLCRKEDVFEVFVMLVASILTAAFMLKWGASLSYIASVAAMIVASVAALFLGMKHRFSDEQPTSLTYRFSHAVNDLMLSAGDYANGFSVCRQRPGYVLHVYYADGEGRLYKEGPDDQLHLLPPPPPQ